MGNPPFKGKKEQKPNEKIELLDVCAGIKSAAILDFVAAWYVKAARYAQENNAIKCAFVATKSITQGEQVGILWSWMLAQGIKIHFAHRTFSWNNEARGKAAVHCVIIGFGLHEVAEKVIYEYEHIKGEPYAIQVNNINPYLIDAPNALLENRKNSICNTHQMLEGSALLDDGHFLLSEDEFIDLSKSYPDCKRWIRKLYSGEGFINNEYRWCLWLKEVSPSELREYPEIMKRIERVNIFRSKSSRIATNRLALTSSLFGELRQPKSDYLFVPKTSSERRKYIPIGFLKPENLINNTSLFVDEASIFSFGIMTSIMHNAWVRAVGGRLKSDLRYSAGIVYNNFPWPEVNTQHTAKIETAAQAVLDARAVHVHASLADLYDPLTMPANLLKAHQALDKAVDAAYGYKGAATDAARVAFLFERYQQITSLLPALVTKTKKVTKKPSN